MKLSQRLMSRLMPLAALALLGADAHAASFTILDTVHSPQSGYASRRLRETLDAQSHQYAV